VIKDVVENFTLQLEEKNGRAELLLNAENDFIDADEVHFSNLIINLIDNAIKYSKDDQPPIIKITTQSTPKSIVIIIEDNGIGRVKAKALKSKTATSRKSLGMQLTESRLGLLNKHAELNASVEILDLENGNQEAAGTKVVLRIPV